MLSGVFLKKQKMKTSKHLLLAVLLAIAVFAIASCANEDPGPLQEQTKEYSILDFERLEIGDALDVTVTQGNMFSVSVSGDRRNIDDLEVNVVGNTLKMNYKKGSHNDNRQYTTYVTIMMPALKGVLFSGAVNSKLSGFESEGNFDVTVSGASSLQADVDAASIKVGLSGASQLNLSGTTSDLQAIVSGASELRAFGLGTTTATVDASGASKVEVLATQLLNATASGASDVRYKGNPTVNGSSSGASTIGAD
jgi:hypothetical protein